MKTLEELKLEYQKLDKEASKYNNPEFTKVYEVIGELVKDREDVGDKGNLALPLVSGYVIDKALMKLGFDKKQKFVSDFKKYREIEQQARDIQLEMIKHPQHPAQKIINETKIKKSGNWRFVQIKIICPEFMSDIINEKLSDDVKTLSGLYGVKTDVIMEDENDDNFLAIEAFGVRSSLEPYYRELIDYKILETYFNYGNLKNEFLSILLEMVVFISNNTSFPNKIRNRISNKIKEFDKYGGIGIIWQILILQGIIKWIENININEGDYGYKELENLLKWVYKFIMEKLVFYSYYYWGEKDLIYLEPLSNYLYSTEVGREVQKNIFEDNDITMQTDNMNVLENPNTKSINHDPSLSYIDRIKNNVLVYGDGWANGKSGQITDLLHNYQLRFCETDENGFCFLQDEEEKIKLPVIACGFVAWLIKHWGEDTKTIFEKYLNLRLNQYVEVHKNAPDAHKRDLENEFFSFYSKQEDDWIKKSEAIFEYITDKEVKAIQEFIKNYKEYINRYSDPLYIDKYTKESQIILDEDWRIKLAYRIFLNYPEKTENFNLIARINDIRAILKYHLDKPDECLNYVMNKYQTIWNISTVFVECLKIIIDEGSVFMILLSNQNLFLHKGTQDEIKKIVEDFNTRNNIDFTKNNSSNERKEYLNINQSIILNLTPTQLTKLRENYDFWQRNGAIKGHLNCNIFEGCGFDTFIEMVQNCDFSLVFVRGNKDRVKYNIYIISRYLGEEWGQKSAEKLNCQFKDLTKNTKFIEYDELKNMYKTLLP